MANRNTAPVYHPDDRKVSFIIPAAGMGNRMKSYGPKCLIEIKNDTTIIENQLRLIHKYFYDPQIIIVTGFESAKVEKRLENKRVQLIYNDEWESSNVGHSASIAIKEVKHKNVIFMNGDLVFNAWTLKVPFGLYSMLLVDDSGFMKEEEVGCLTNDKEAINLMYDIDSKWAQIAYFTGEELEILKSVLDDDRTDRCFMFEVINCVMQLGGSFMAHTPKRMKVTDIDSSKDLKKIDKVLQ